MFNLPINIAAKVGCSPHTLYKINQGLRRPSPALAKKIIDVMAERGVKLSLADLRPDLAALLQ